jgi:large subunit ribosomal protein L5
MNKDNKMREIAIEKITLNFGAGKDADLLEKGIKLVKMIAGKDPVKTYTIKRIPEWGLRPGLPLGCKLTLRGRGAEALLKRLLKAKDDVLKESCFSAGNFAFGIPEYIDIPDAKYSPELGILGFEVAVTLKRPGFRIKCRKKQKKKISSRHLISKEETINFAKQKLGIKFGED